MKEYKLYRQGEQYLCRDGELIVYRGHLTPSQGHNVLTMCNAFGDVLFSMRMSKNSGLRLRRNRRGETLKFTYEGRTGSLMMGEDSYEWRQGDCLFHIACHKVSDHVDLLVQDRYEPLACVIAGECMMKHACYSAQICAMWMIMQEWRTDTLIEMDEALFLQRQKAVVS